MGLFRRRAKNIEDDGRDAKPHPVDPASVDLVEARAVIAPLVQGIGSDGKIRGAIPRLLQASGMPHPDDAGAAMAAFREDHFLTTRVWRWLLAVALRANEDGQNDLAAMAAYWSLVWNTTVVPNMVGADFISLGFDRPPDDTLKELLGQGGIAISRLPDEFVVAQTSEPETITVAMLRGVLPPDFGSSQGHAERDGRNFRARK